MGEVDTFGEVVADAAVWQVRAEAAEARVAKLDARVAGLETLLRWLYHDSGRLTDRSRWPLLLRDVLKGKGND